MFQIVKKEMLSPLISRMTVLAPLAARRAEPGQFIILRVSENGERIPLTIGGFNKEAGTIDIMFQVAGATTEKLMAKNEGDYLNDFAGPLGRPTEINGLKKACVIGGGIGCAIAYPIAEALTKQGTETTVIIGFRDTGRIILEVEFKKASANLDILTDDGSNGRQGFTTAALEERLNRGERWDEVIAIGPIRMMQAVSNLTAPFGIKTTVSMNPIMIDGTGMCGCCRLTVGGEMKFACVDGPDFDGHAVDWEEAVLRNSMYRDFEKHAHGDVCKLLGIERAGA